MDTASTLNMVVTIVITIHGISDLKQRVTTTSSCLLIARQQLPRSFGMWVVFQQSFRALLVQCLCMEYLVMVTVYSCIMCGMWEEVKFLCSANHKGDILLGN